MQYEGMVSMLIVVTKLRGMLFLGMSLGFLATVLLVTLKVNRRLFWHQDSDYRDKMRYDGILWRFGVLSAFMLFVALVMPSREQLFHIFCAKTADILVAENPGTVVSLEAIKVVVDNMLGEVRVLVIDVKGMP